MQRPFHVAESLADEPLMSARPVHFLLVDDDVVDVMAIQRAFKNQRIANPMIRVKDGVEALEALRGETERPKLPRPYIILLDLKMPRMTGIEFLRKIRADSELRDSIVFVLTTSDSDTDKTAAFENNVAGYIVKTDAGNGLLNVMAMIDAYWQIVELPS